jgi:hypothetical protein
MQNFEKLVDKCNRLDEEMEVRYKDFQDLLDKRTGVSRKTITEENIVSALDSLDSIRHEYNAFLKREKKALQAAEAIHKKAYKIIKRYYAKKSSNLEAFIEANPEYDFDVRDPDLGDLIDSKDTETYIQANDDYIAVARMYGNQLSFYTLIEKEIESLKERGFRLNQAAKNIRHDQGNFG